mgnify:CR=1 FL=1
MANLFDVYTKLHKQQKPKTLLAIHASDEYLFFEEDAKRISDVLGEEMTSYKITYGHNANVFKLPVNRTEEVFGQLIDEGYLKLIEKSIITGQKIETYQITKRGYSYHEGTI